MFWGRYRVFLCASTAPSIVDPDPDWSLPARQLINTINHFFVQNYNASLICTEISKVKMVAATSGPSDYCSGHW